MLFVKSIFNPAVLKVRTKKIKRLKSDAVPTINLRATTLDHTAGTGFPLKDARLSILKNIPYLHSAVIGKVK